MNIAVLVSGGGTNLQALIDAGNLGGEIKLVISSSADAFALKRAEKAGVDTAVILRQDYGSAQEYSKALVAKLREYNTDLVVLAGFMIVIDKCFTDAFKNRIINVHPSLIPAFCGKGFYGLRVHEAALARGVKLTGATVHFVNEECDGGPIILQKCVSVLDDDTPETLQKRVMQEAEWDILPKAVRLFCEGKLKGRAL